MEIRLENPLACISCYSRLYSMSSRFPAIRYAGVASRHSNKVRYSRVTTPSGLGRYAMAPAACAPGQRHLPAPVLMSGWQYGPRGLDRCCCGCAGQAPGRRRPGVAAKRQSPRGRDSRASSSASSLRCATVTLQPKRASRSASQSRSTPHLPPGAAAAVAPRCHRSSLCLASHLSPQMLARAAPR